MKLKKFITISAVILVIIVSFLAISYTCLFTDHIFKPKYLYSSDYNDYAKEQKQIVSIDEIYSIGLHYDDLKATRNNLKYCKNLKLLFISNGHYPDLDFLSELNSVEVLGIYVEPDDWNGLKGCKNAKEITIDSSAFSDFGLLEGFSNLSRLWVDSKGAHNMNYSGFDTLISLNELSIVVNNIDLKEVSKASNLKNFCMVCANEIQNPEDISTMNSLENLYFMTCDLSSDLVCQIHKINKIKKIVFRSCNFSGTKEEFEKYIDELSDKGIAVEVEKMSYSEQ